MSFDPKAHMMNLKGKEYLQVMWRLVWFREEHPDWSIDSSAIEADAEHAVFKAVICDENGLQKSSGHGSESKRDFGDFLEKAETKAVGRALAMLGYGTQFAPELDEGERIVDSPVKPAKAPKAEEILCEDCGRPIHEISKSDGTILSAKEVAESMKKTWGRCLCVPCGFKAKQKQEQTA